METFEFKKTTSNDALLCEGILQCPMSGGASKDDNVRETKRGAFIRAFQGVGVACQTTEMKAKTYQQILIPPVQLSAKSAAPHRLGQHCTTHTKAHYSTAKKTIRL